jgi:hypothetical protein
LAGSDNEGGVSDSRWRSSWIKCRYNNIDKTIKFINKTIILPVTSNYNKTTKRKVSGIANKQKKLVITKLEGTDIMPRPLNNPPAFGDDTFGDNDDDFWFDWMGEILPFLLVVFAGVYGIFMGEVLDAVERSPAVAEQRLNWEEHRDREVARGLFRRMYRIELEDFELLLSLLRERLTVNETMALNRSVTGAIIPELSLHCLLRWLAGGSYIDIVSKVNMPPSTF